MNSSKLPHDERRKHQRFSANNRYTLIIQGRRYSGKIGNISEGGLYLYLENASPMISEESMFKDGEIILELPTAEIKVKCSVSYVATDKNINKYGVGIAFVGVDEATTTMISQFIETIK